MKIHVKSTLTILSCIIAVSVSKLIEGHLKTADDWAFLARFCFISGRGRYEYEIEFERRYGEPELLLYYDDINQWPAVYKTSKTCLQKLSVLSRYDNQIVTLSARFPHRTLSGCKIRNENGEKPTTPSTTRSTSQIDSTHYDQFLKSTTPINNETDFEEFDGNFTATMNTSALSSNESISYFDEEFPHENRMENSTSFESDVEEFPEKYMEADEDGGRVPRAVPGLETTRLIVKCHNIGGFTSSRERWWYIAISNCGSQKGIDIKYKFRMTNGPPGDFWHEHFSADEIYIPPILLTETFAYTFLLLAIFLCAVELKMRHLFHCTYRLFTFSAFMQMVGVLCQACSWARYAITGLGPYTVLGGLFTGASEISFLSLMLLMAKGYTITRARLSSCTIVKLTVYINVYIVGFISLYIYQSEQFDPGEVLNLYESPAGFGLCGLRVGAWVAFLFSIGGTVKKYPEKGAFYYPFGLMGSVWLVGGPILTFIGIGVLDPWVRESVMSGAMALMAFGGHAAFLWLTWPSRANTSFPYHVRTNHVGIASDDDGLDYPRHQYEPSADPNVVIPFTRNTDDILNGVYNQYMREREYYESAATPVSHISFTQHSPSAPELLRDTADMQIPHAEEMRGVHKDFMVPSEVRNKSRPPTAEIEEISQVDSGHPSLENTSQSPPSESAEIQSQKDANPPQRVVLKNNPFLVNGVSRAPNKVILDPIEFPLSRTSTQDNIADESSPQQTPGIQPSVNDVPKHLFAAKKSSSNINN